MRKLCVLALLCLGANAYATISVSGNLKDASGAAVTSGSSVRFWLRGCSGNQPIVSGTALVNPNGGNTVYFDFKPDATGAISGTLYSASEISCGGHTNVIWWGMQAYSNGRPGPESAVDASANINVNSPTLLSSNPVADIGTSVLQGYVFTQASTATTWTINHNLNAAVSVEFFDSSGALFWPNTVVQTSSNTLTATFTTPQSGTAVLHKAGVISLATGTQAILSNPGTNQTITGAFSLTLDTLTASTVGGATFSGNNSFSGTNSHSGTETFTGPIVAGKVNGLLYVDGTKYATLAAAYADCATAGCVIDMRGNSSALTLGTFDPSTKTVWLLLGPYGYTATQIVLRNNFHLYGSGSNSSNGTVITATSTTTPLIVLGGTSPIAGVELRGFRLEGAAANTTHGISIVAQANGGGLWYSSIKDIQIGATTGFGGIGLNFDGSAGGTPNGINQFITIENVFVFGPAGRTYTCQFLGANGQFTITNLQCDGNSQSSGTNINIASSSGTLYPYSLKFTGATIQGAAVGVRISGAVAINFDQVHCEHVSGFLNMSLGTGSVNSYAVTIQNGEFTSCGSNTGSGYLVSNSAGASNSSVHWFNNRLGVTPDAFFTGFTSNLIECGTLLGGGAFRPCQFGRWRANGSGIGVGQIGTLSAGWGTSPSVSSASGYDSAFTFTISSGTGSPTANPTGIVTFPDGTWTNNPVCSMTRADANAPIAATWTVSAVSATTMTFTFVGTPGTSTAYSANVQCIGK